MIAAHSDVLLLVHVIWSTVDRRPELEVTRDAWLHETISIAAIAFRSSVIAIGNAADHVHVVAQHRASVSVGDLVQRLKGTSSRLWNARSGTPTLRWQRGYWARSIDQSSLATLVPYVRHQREHHHSLRIDPSREQNLHDQA